MGFGIYVHIPYCLQICTYCDFAKYELGTIMPPERYTELLVREIRARAHDMPNKEVTSIYFGGGTPSLFEPELILTVLKELATASFTWDSSAEVTIEIDPATVDEARLDAYLAMGINRFSVGVQSFNERILKIAGRKHTAQDSVNLLSILKRKDINYSFDLLFAMPTQTLSELKLDLVTALDFNPTHMSAYCLTVPEGHALNRGRAPEGEQVEMFSVIEDTLATKGIVKYELSNFARGDRPSRHNLLYWSDQPYWGLGVSAHSYLPMGSASQSLEWGARFWNRSSIKGYVEEIVSTQSDRFAFFSHLPEAQIEKLEARQSLTDFCHTSLRLTRGLSEDALRLKYGSARALIVLSRLEKMEQEGLLEKADRGWRLSRSGQTVANLVFEKLTFLEGDLA